jgi:hypothetical protein
MFSKRLRDRSSGRKVRTGAAALPTDRHAAMKIRLFNIFGAFVSFETQLQRSHMEVENTGAATPMLGRHIDGFDESPFR